MEKHMDITNRLNEAIAAYTTKTGLKVWCIYLGRLQMRELLTWADANASYIAGPDFEGKNRPEYCGALVFEVNDEDHMNVS
jgi:hypothetical protein